MYSEQKLQEAETDTAHSGQRARDGARRAEFERIDGVCCPCEGAEWSDNRHLSFITRNSRGGLEQDL